jgi:hypothetical protein
LKVNDNKNQKEKYRGVKSKAPIGLLLPLLFQLGQTILKRDDFLHVHTTFSFFHHLLGFGKLFPSPQSLIPHILLYFFFNKTANPVLKTGLGIFV